MTRALLLGLTACAFQAHGGGGGTHDAGRDDAAVLSDATAIDAPPDTAPAIDAAPHSTLVQKCTNVALAGGRSIACTLPAPETAGDTNIVVVDWGDVAVVSNLSDTAGNTYVATGVVGASDITSTLYYATVAHGGGTNQITALLSSPATIPKIRVFEYAGLAASPYIIGVAGAGAMATSFTAGPVTTIEPHALLFAAMRPQHTGAAVGPFVAVDNSDGDVVETEEVYAGGTYSASGTEVMAGTWVMLLAAFRGL